MDTRTVYFTTLKMSELKPISHKEFNACIMSQSIPTGYMPSGNPWGFAKKNCPGGRDLTFESCLGAGNLTRAGILWKVQTMLNAI